MFSLISTVYPIKFLSPPPIFSALDFHPTLPVYMHAQLQLPDDSGPPPVVEWLLVVPNRGSM